MNQYETVFILTPVLSDEQMKETVAKFEKVLTDNGAEILNKEAWGLKKLAYNIEKKTSGFYSLVEFKAEPTVIAKLETAYRRDEKVIRYMTLKPTTLVPDIGSRELLYMLRINMGITLGKLAIK